MQNTSVVTNLCDVFWTSNKCLDINIMRSNLYRKSSIIHDNTTNNTPPKGRRQIIYGYIHQYRKIRPSQTEVY